MRVFRISMSLWYDPFWWRLRRRSWKTRRYWIARPPAVALDGRALAVQLGPLTVRLLLQGRIEAPSRPRGGI